MFVLTYMVVQFHGLSFYLYSQVHLAKGHLEHFHVDLELYRNIHLLLRLLLPYFTLN